MFRFATIVVGFIISATIFAQSANVDTTDSPVATNAVTEEAAIAVTPTSAPDGNMPIPGDVQSGQQKASVCAACHGLDGNSVDAQYPKIAGQHENYISRQLKLFKTGERENVIMLGIAASLTLQDMHDIGAYFATQKGMAGVANDVAISDSNPETWAKHGERIYRGGNMAVQVPACMACHGPTGRGNPGTVYPSLAGQHADYTKAKLLSFRAGGIWGKEENENTIMSLIAKNLSDTDIEALSTYIEGLHAIKE